MVRLRALQVPKIRDRRSTANHRDAFIACDNLAPQVEALGRQGHAHAAALLVAAAFEQLAI
jgi:hypothetical protein